MTLSLTVVWTHRSVEHPSGWVCSPRPPHTMHKSIGRQRAKHAPQLSICARMPSHYTPPRRRLCQSSNSIALCVAFIRSVHSIVQQYKLFDLVCLRFGRRTALAATTRTEAHRRLMPWLTPNIEAPDASDACESTLPSSTTHGGGAEALHRGLVGCIVATSTSLRHALTEEVDADRCHGQLLGCARMRRVCSTASTLNGLLLACRLQCTAAP